MNSDDVKPTRGLGPVWAVAAAFGTYFCMYGFRKPFTSADYADAVYWGIDFKTVLVVTQVGGYMLSKFLGIKVVSETPPHRRGIGILLLIGVSWAGLLAFGVLPRPWNGLGLFANGLALGMVFGLVLGFLEGRRLTEALVAGLCTSFILADGVTKAVGAWLLQRGVTEDWMPFCAGAVFALPLCVCVGVLSRTRPPGSADVAARSERTVMTGAERWTLFRRNAVGLSLIVAVYLLVTVVRSIRADFAPELWRGLGEPAKPSTFARSELWVAIGVVLVNGLAVCLRDNRRAFDVSLVTCGLGLLLLAGTLAAHAAGVVGAFPFMVLVGLGLYLPYVAIHTTVFERLLAMTRERGNLGFLMYLADAMGYLAYVCVMLGRRLFAPPEDVTGFFVTACVVACVVSLACLVAARWYFTQHERVRGAVTATTEPLAASDPVPTNSTS